MLFEPLSIHGAFIIRPERREDHRGHFARVWCEDEAARAGLRARMVQINTGFSPRAGTLRGMHFQLPPHVEVKVARCTRGAAFDVVVDLRRGSSTFRQWAGVTLTPEDGSMVYVPEGCAHGYLTLEPDTELIYLTSNAYHAQSARGVRHDDPAFGIDWPAPVTVISDADKNWPRFIEDAAIELSIGDSK